MIEYTMDDVDAAIEAGLGTQVYRALRDGAWDRPAAMERAAIAMWLSRRPPDDHEEVLRAAMLHMRRTGVILPEDVRRR